MSPPKIQIAFQGGGAKFLAMLPVAHAFCDCEKGEKIAISAIAGTSAGAICAALVAADCDFDKLRTYIKHEGKTHLNRLIHPDTLTLADRLRNLTIFNVLKIFAVVRSRNTLSSIFNRGLPVLNEAEFGSFLNAILTFCSHGDQAIEELPKQLSITATNIANSYGITFNSGSIKKALRDSCALPLLFRSFNNLLINHHVDGGICNNLPVDCLIDDVSAPIFAVFAEETLDPPPPGTVFLYLLSLFAASINHNDQRSKDMISDAFHISVKTDFSTFSFSKALDVFEDDNWYEKEYTKVYDKIVDFATNYGDIHTKHQYRFIDTKNINDYIKSLECATNDYGEVIKHKDSRLIVRINCADKLDKNIRNLRRLADNVTRIVRFEVTNGRFRYYRSAVSMTGGKATPSVWRALNETNGTELPIRILSLESIVGSAKRCVVEFIEPEKNIKVGDIIKITDTAYHKDAMIKVNFGTSDSIEVANLHNVLLEKVECILSYPRRLGKLDIRLQLDKNENDVPETSVGKLPIKDIYENQEIGMSATNVEAGKHLRCKIFYE